jgi:hypothetical protein
MKHTETVLNWTAPKDEFLTIGAITKRALKLMPNSGLDPLNLNMDITATHLNGCPLKLKELLEAPEFDFAHDVLGITSHIDRETGKLLHCFLPRYSK